MGITDSENGLTAFRCNRRKSRIERFVGLLECIKKGVSLVGDALFLLFWVI